MTTSARRRMVAAALADAFRFGEWEPAAMAARGRRAVSGRRRVWLDQLSRATRSGFPDPPHDRPRELASFIEACPPFRTEWSRALAAGQPLAVRQWFPAPTAMGAAPDRWEVRPIPDVRALRDWLGLDAGELAWFADVRSLERTVAGEALRHYRYRWVQKRSGAGGRLLEAPKPRLKAIQRAILAEVLDPIPVHPAAHGFRRQRGVRTAAAVHVGRDVVVHLDLEAFFTTVSAGRVFGLFRTAGYPEPVAHVLTGLVTNAAPRWAFPAEATPYAVRHALRSPHLPQGAPTSPALANLAAFGLDRRLRALAARVDASYTRYADDLVFSGGRATTALVPAVRSVAMDEGFRVNDAKTTVRRRHERQRVTGVVVNDRPNVARDDYDRLKALLHNAARHGAESQNRQRHPHFGAHVLGRISWVESLNPERGRKLRAAYDRVDWS